MRASERPRAARDGQGQVRAASRRRPPEPALVTSSPLPLSANPLRKPAAPAPVCRAPGAGSGGGAPRPPRRRLTPAGPPGPRREGPARGRRLGKLSSPALKIARLSEGPQPAARQTSSARGLGPGALGPLIPRRLARGPSDRSRRLSATRLPEPRSHARQNPAPEGHGTPRSVR